MVTKIQAAELATKSGATVVIAQGTERDVIIRLAAGEAMGTRFLPTASKMESRKRWILAESVERGEIQVDEGAARALKHEGKSLLSVGVVAVFGNFNRGASIGILDPKGKEIAHGIVRYGAAELERIKGMHSERIEEILGYDYGDEVVHRDDLVVF
jgi:glutamate 5-kinase